MAWLHDCYNAAGVTTTHANNIFSAHLSLDLPDPSPSEVWDWAKTSEILIADYQDLAYDQRYSAPTYAELQTTNIAVPTRDTVIVRNWYSVVASRLTYIAKRRDTANPSKIMAASDWPTTAERWINHASILGQTSASDGRLVGVNYDSWCADQAYRECLAGRYGVANSESTLDEVPDYGSGSSFDGLSTNGDARSMNVLRRWENLKPELIEAYLNTINIERLTMDGLNKELFGFGYSEVVQSISGQVLYPSS